MVSRPDWIERRRIKKLIPRGGIEHITHAGNSRGPWSRDQIIDWIEQGSYQFFTCVNEKLGIVLVRTEPGWLVSHRWYVTAGFAAAFGAKSPTRWVEPSLKAKLEPNPPGNHREIFTITGRSSW